MNILQVVHSLPPYTQAGTEIYTYNLAKELKKRNNTFIFNRVCDFKRKEFDVWKEKIDEIDIYLINNTFKNYVSFKDTYKNEVIAAKFSAILNELRPDIVHIQHLLYLSTAIIEEINKKSIPIIFTLHDYWLICPQGQLLKNSYKICNNENYSECVDCILHQLCIRKNTFNYYYFLKSLMPDDLLQIIKKNYLKFARSAFLTSEEATKKIKNRTKYIKEICPKIDLFISPSEFLRKKFIAFGIPEQRIISLRYGFNLNQFQNQQKEPANKLRFGFIGNLLPAKGIDILIEAFNKVKDNNVELKIYGKVFSYKGLLEGYLRNIKKIVKNKSIKFMGGFDNREVANIFREIDVLIVPSVWQENSPLVIQEAFASRTPVIASDIGGIPELIQDGGNGLLFQAGNINSLYEKIKSVIDNPQLLSELRQNIEPPRDIKVNALEIEEIYRRYI